jgi:hypothetical protein
MKSKKIQLVLITAALASCNRTIIPEQQFVGPTIDSTLITRPSHDDSLFNNGFAGCDCGSSYYRLWNYSFSPNNIYNIAPINGNYYFPTHRQSKIIKAQNNQVVVRGGFGSSRASAGS